MVIFLGCFIFCCVVGGITYSRSKDLTTTFVFFVTSIGLSVFLYLIFSLYFPKVIVDECTYDVYNYNGQLIYFDENNKCKDASYGTIAVSPDDKYHVKVVKYDDLYVWFEDKTILEVPIDKVKKID